MNITVRLFAICRDLAKTDTVTLQLRDGGSGNDLWVELLKQYPELADLKKRTRLAVNLEYVSDRIELKDGDEVSLIPPVSGG